MAKKKTRQYAKPKTWYDRPDNWYDRPETFRHEHMARMFGEVCADLILWVWRYNRRKEKERNDKG